MLRFQSLEKHTIKKVNIWGFYDVSLIHRKDALNRGLTNRLYLLHLKLMYVIAFIVSIGKCCKRKTAYKAVDGIVRF